MPTPPGDPRPRRRRDVPLAHGRRIGVPAQLGAVLADLATDHRIGLSSPDRLLRPR